MLNPNQLFKLYGYQICIICDEEESKNEIGSGFLFMRKDWIVTASHVVIKNGLPRKKIYGKCPGPDNIILSLKVIAVHFENDIALLQITNDDNPCERPLYPGHDDLSVSSGLVYCGYTPSKGQNITIGLVGVYNKAERERDEIEVLLEFESIDIEPGSSGGPIFGDGGVVLGVLIELVDNINNSGKKYARATSIQNFLRGIVIDMDNAILKPVPMDE